MSVRPGAVLKRGDVCRVEIFPMIAGYHAGVCRTAAVGARAAARRAHLGEPHGLQILLLDAIKPGASTRAIYERYLDKLSELDLPPISFIGHGIGLGLHEDPYLGPTEIARLKPEWCSASSLSFMKRVRLRDAEQGHGPGHAGRLRASLRLSRHG